MLEFTVGRLKAKEWIQQGYTKRDFGDVYTFNGNKRIIHILALQMKIDVELGHLDEYFNPIPKINLPKILKGVS